MSEAASRTNWSDSDAVRVASLLTGWSYATMHGDAELQNELRSQLTVMGVTVAYREPLATD